MFKNKKAILAGSFGLPVLIMIIIFIARGIFPFGDRSFLFSDMYHQYMPFFSEFMRKMKAGEGLAYSYNVGIGSNFLALYVYYLASPLHWLAFLVPEAYLMEFMSYLAVVKIGFCGLTAAYYLQKRFGKNDFGILFFACFYALSGFMAAYNWNIMWLDCVVLLPILMLGLERLVKEGKCGLYCVTLALSIFTNYYISIMLCMFLVLYFFVLLLTEKRSWRILGNFTLYSLLAGGMAAILLIPEVCAIIVTDFGNMDFPEKLESYFSVLDMLARHCMCITTERGLEHWPNIYSGVAVFLLLPMYALCDKIGIRKRFANLALSGFLLLGFSTNILDFIWHGMNYPDSLPARQSFIYIFLILILCYESYLHVRETSEKQILYGYLGAVVFLLFCEKFVESDDFEIGIEMLTLCFVSVYAVLLYLYRTRKEERVRFIVAVVALVTVVAEVTMNTAWTSVGTVSRSGYLGQQADYQALYEYAAQQEDAIFRLEKFDRRTQNDGTLAGYPTASVFSSTMNSSVMDMYKRLGMRHSKVYYGFDGATAFTGALLNVNYMFGESEKYENSLYELLEKSGDIYLYRCKYTLPFGYVVPSNFDLPEGDSTNGIVIQNRLMNGLGISGKLFTECKSEAAGDDVRFTAKESGVYYARISNSGTNKAEVIGGPLETQSFKDLKDESILYLGQLYEGDTITITNGNEEDETPKIGAEVYLLDEEVLQQAIALLSRQYLTDVTYDSTNVSGHIRLEEAGKMVLSIPYERGWSVLINGEEAEPELFGGTLMAFSLEPGEYDFDLHYRPTGSLAGVGVSAVSLAIFVVLLWLGKPKKKEMTEETEGEGV